MAPIGPETTAPRTREPAGAPGAVCRAGVAAAGEIASAPQRGCRVQGPRFSRDPSADTGRSLDLCRPAAILGALEAISRLTLATRRSLSFACAVVSGLTVWAEVTKSNESAFHN